MYRVLVTGSRSWTDRAVVAEGLEMAKEFLGVDEFILVHGACPRGADQIASSLWPTYLQEPHPANWAVEGKRAGFVRDSEMVNSGVSLTLAFIRDGSKGATMTRDMSEKKNIPTLVWTLTSPLGMIG